MDAPAGSSAATDAAYPPVNPAPEPEPIQRSTARPQPVPPPNRLDLDAALAAAMELDGGSDEEPHHSPSPTQPATVSRQAGPVEPAPWFHTTMPMFPRLLRTKI